MKGLCSFCPQRSAYVCPTCSRPYCSAGCYKSTRHQGCAQRFFRRCVLEEFEAGDDIPSEVSQQVVSMLAEEKKRQNSATTSCSAEEENDDDHELDSDDDLSLEERLKDVNLDDTDRVWRALTAEEREDFRQQLESDSIEVDEWRPWWCVALRRGKLVTIIPTSTASTATFGKGSGSSRTSNSSDSATTRERRTSTTTASVNATTTNPYMPALLTHVPPLSVLLRGTSASPLVFYKLVTVLYSYTYLQVLFEERWRSAEAVPALWRVSPLLGVVGRLGVDEGGGSTGTLPATIADALRMVDTAVLRSQWQLPQADQVLQAREGVFSLFGARSSSRVRPAKRANVDVTYALAALSHLWRTIDEYWRACRHSSNTTPTLALSFASNDVCSVDRRRLKLALKQIDFLFAWTRDSKAVIKEKLFSAENTRVVLPNKDL